MLSRTLLLIFALLLLWSLAQGGINQKKRQYEEYILEPPPCRSEPEKCNSFCTQQEECPGKLQCCSAYCGIVCTANKDPVQNT
ncbi:Protein WFDC13 [Cricetulus griseus]|uniref:Protein WFDC13 n=1 Tax=Cricetulus griseus TaxID=10029 RepID=G3HLT8_CRIGR|nr:Protein WFDC13 [Cricetulus griseus]